jgi:hypothetical protein
MLFSTLTLDTYKNLSTQFIVLKEKVISDSYGLLFELNNYLYDAYNEVIVRLNESGITQYIVDSFKTKQKKANNDPVPLSIHHLLIWFEIWISVLLIAIVAFLFEVFMGKLSRMLVKRAVGMLKFYWECVEDL